MPWPKLISLNFKIWILKMKDKIQVSIILFCLHWLKRAIRFLLNLLITGNISAVKPRVYLAGHIIRISKVTHIETEIRMVRAHELLN